MTALLKLYHVSIIITILIRNIDSNTTYFNVSTDDELIQSSLNVKWTNYENENNLNLTALNMWSIDQFLTESMALKMSNRIYHQFMNITQRDNFFDFVTAKYHTNDKLMGSDPDICKYEIRFYCKYEYKRDLPLHKSLLSFLNSTIISNIMSKILNITIIGISDLFISVFNENNYLLTHKDKGLGQYAFIIFLSQNWDFDMNGGRLIFDCQQLKGIKHPTCCSEMRFKFNEMVIFQVHPNSVPHHVERVKITQPRIAITGWFYTKQLICTECVRKQKGYTYF